MPTIDSELEAFESRLAYHFADRELLRRALTHKSYAHESRETTARDNETMEFLGDSVLGFVVGDLLFARFGSVDEGGLSKMKAWLVSSHMLAVKARELRAGDAVLLGVGEERSGGRRKDSLLANVFEALIAAVYLDGGIEAARRLIENLFEDDIQRINSEDLLFHDFKTALQEVVQAEGLPLPEYAVVDEVGPDHRKQFVVEVRLGRGVTARGNGASKKEAQQQAAKHALEAWRDLKQ